MSAPSSPMNKDPFTAAVSNSEVHNGGGPGHTQELAEQASPAASTTLGLGLGQGSPIVVTNGIERMVIDVQESNNASPSPRRADRGPPIAPLVTTPVPHKRKRTEGGEDEPNKRSVRMPKWEATLFNVSDDWYRHQALFQTELSKFPGLSGSQKSQFLLGSLNPTLRAAATAFHFGQGFPRAEIILGHMARTFPNTPGNSGED